VRDLLADIFEEVEEDLRAERARRLALRYGAIAGLAATIAVSAVAGWQGWRWYQTRYDIAAASAFYVAARAAESSIPIAQTAPAAQSTAEEGFSKIVAGGPPGYRTLAALRAAALKSDSGDLTGAALLWDQVARDNSADQILRDLASLLWVDHQLSSLDPAVLDARLALLVSETNPWHSLAQEAQAMLQIREGHAERAKQILHDLEQDSASPEGVRNRASGVLARLNG